MKRITKNIIMSILIIITMGTIFIASIQNVRDTESTHETVSTMNNQAPQPGENGGNLERPSNISNTDEKKLSTSYIICLSCASLILVALISYLVMSKFNKYDIRKTFRNKDKIIIYVLLIIFFTPLLTLSIAKIDESLMSDDSEIKDNREEETEKDEVTLDESNIVTSSTIDLSAYDSDITINTAGTYTISGEFTHTIIIDALEDDEVIIILNGVTITNDNTATIIALNGKSLTIQLAKNTTNILNDGGNSEYDGCIYSNIPLIFSGSGTLEVNGNQNEGEGIATETQDITFNGGTYIVTSNDDGINAGGDGGTITINDGTFYINASGDGIDSNQTAVINGGTIFVIGSDVGGDSGIDTDGGYTINGGVVVALGSDMIETPLDTSKQKTIAFTLDTAVTSDTIVTLMQDDEVIVSFVVPKSFKTIIISTDTLTNADYSLYMGGTNSGTLVNGIYQKGKYTKGTKLSVNSNDTFTISKIINYFGSSNK